MHLSFAGPKKKKMRKYETEAKQAALCVNSFDDGESQRSSGGQLNGSQMVGANCLKEDEQNCRKILWRR